MKRLALILMVALLTVAVAAGRDWGTVKFSKILLINHVTGDTYAYIDSAGFHGVGAGITGVDSALVAATAYLLAANGDSGQVLGMTDDTTQGWIDQAGSTGLDTVVGDLRYLGINATADNADLLQGKDTTWVKAQVGGSPDSVMYADTAGALKQVYTEGDTIWTVSDSGDSIGFYFSNDTLFRIGNVTCYSTLNNAFSGVLTGDWRGTFFGLDSADVAGGGSNDPDSLGGHAALDYARRDSNNAIIEYHSPMVTDSCVANKDTINLVAGLFHRIVLDTGVNDIEFTGGVAGMRALFKVVQASGAVNSTVTWPTMTWMGAAPVLDTTNGAADWIAIVHDGGYVGSAADDSLTATSIIVARVYGASGVVGFYDDIQRPDRATAWGDSVYTMTGDAANTKLITDYFRIQDTLKTDTVKGGWVYLFTIPAADSVAVTWCQLWLDSVSVTGTGNDAAFSFSVGDSNVTADPTLSGGEITWIASTASNATLALGFTTAAMSGTNLISSSHYVPFSVVTSANKVYVNWGGTCAADGRLGLRGRLLMGFRSNKIGAW